MPKITPRKESQTVTVKTNTQAKIGAKAYKWWLARSRADLGAQTLDTFTFLKDGQQYRYRQCGIFARLYGNLPLWNFAGSSSNSFSNNLNLPTDRPTMNVIQSCVDTLTSRVTQSRPRPVFLTDNGDYKERNLAKQMNSFINGELYQTDAYQLGELLLRDAEVFGTGCVKIFEQDNKVMLERRLLTELLTDPNDAVYGKPRQLFEMKLVDRQVLADAIPEYKSDIARAEQAYPVNYGDEKTISDQIMVVEAWHLPSSKDATDGRHVIVCSSGVVLDEPWTKDCFPYVFLHYSPQLTGFWGQGLCEQLMGTQVEINKLLQTISQSINLVGVPRVFIESGSKVVKSHINNQIGALVYYTGTKPVYEVAPCVPQELYAQLQRLVDYAYQQSGVSALAAAAQKPAGLNSGEAIRNYDDLQSDRFAALVRRYDMLFVDLAYQITDLAKDIAEREGSYQTVYPNKNGTKEIDLPNVKLLQNEFVIQCFDASSLPRDPAGRLQKVTEMMQSGIVSVQEGRRLLDYPDIEQVEKLANSGEERILQILDEIVDKGKYTPPDPFMDRMKAKELVTQYYNLYAQAKLEEDKQQMLRNFSAQIDALNQAAMPPPQPMQGAPLGVPQAPPTSDQLPLQTAPGSGAA